MITRRTLALLAPALLLPALPLPALAQGTPPALPRTITLIVPFGPGTVVDIMARAYAEPLRQALGGGTTVVVVNREGAGGSIAAAAVAQARPDGATIGFGPSGMLTTQPFLVPSLTYRLDRFEAICQTFENVFALAVPARSPHRTLAEFLAAAREKPESLSFGHAGNGTVGHLIGRQLEILSGTRFNDVAYRAGGQMMTDAQAGTVDMVATTWATLRDSGLRLLAVAADARDPTLGQVPTLAELGFPVNWRGFGGLWAPVGLPQPVAQRLEAACLEATASDTYRSVMASAAQVVAPLDARRFSDRLVAEQREAQALLGRLGLIAP
ncbi:tripartite tricarboxylate transporter substrate binding protein [Roseomonas stagni]|uniref:Tripartite tricarboxylate transporter substrate binding protein n=1 Tax=Falsiroseomonas algicola TaxID=2716930 RepID=A0A6M1LSH8_9PROT|nr:tripartite tricarboxylate transporter substrate binding protein [Falsiroseomonas algicola]NGM23411.1 tripartite tricarboxylate transporter substrate binding protein [Falsiroseomonas algicola]